MSKLLVIYHDSCTDGFGAAFAAWLKFGDEANYLPMQYGQMDLKHEEVFDPHKNYHTGHRFHPDALAEKEVYILDFSFSRETMEHLFTHAKRVVWLDHHKTAFEMWCYDRKAHFYQSFGGVKDHYTVLDNNKSGALLAWEYFHPGTEVPRLIQHIDDRDRWQFKLEGSKELHVALASYQPWSFEQWQERLFHHTSTRLGNYYAEGAAILRAQNAAVAQAVKHARGCCIRLYDPAHDSWQRAEYGPEEFSGLAVSCPLHQSEVGHELANLSGTFGLIWYMSNDGRINCSLRSNEDYDVSAIAKEFGGGGHRNAAGFQTDVQTLMGWLK